MRLHNFASIVEDKTVAQAQLVADLPFVYPHVALTPDTHLGKGSSVAPVSRTPLAVIPAAARSATGLPGPTLAQSDDDASCRVLIRRTASDR